MTLQQPFGQELIDKIGVMVIGLDADCRIILANAKGCTFLGYHRDELLGLDWCEHFLQPQDRSSERQFFARAMIDENLSDSGHDNVVLLRSREQRLVRWHISHLADVNGAVTGILCTGEDVSRQRQLEDELQRREERCRSFATHPSDTLLIFDRQGRLCEVNDQACALLGYSREEMLSLSVFNIDPSFAMEKCVKLLQEELPEPPAVFQGEFLTKEGDTVGVKLTVDVITRQGTSRFVAVATDVSDDVRQQRRLQDSQGILRILIDTLPDIICIKDGQGRWLLANAFDLRLFGLEGVNYRGKTDAELAPFSPFYRDAFLTCMDTDELAWSADGPSRKDENIPLKDGTARVFDVYKIPLFHENGQRRALVVTGRDITEKTRIEETYRKLFDQSPLPYLSASVTGVIEKINQAVVDTFGYGQNEIEGRKIVDFMTSDSKKRFNAHYFTFLETEEFSGNDFEVVCKDGAVAMIHVCISIVKNDSAIPVRVHCILFDVTKQREMEKKVRESEQRYQLLFERSPVGILNFDIDLQITDCNERLVQILGTPKDHLLGFNLNTINNSSVLPALMAPLSGEESQFKGPYVTSTTDKKLYLSIRTAPIFNSQHEISGGVAIVEDISDKEKIEREQARFMSAIEQASETIVITDSQAAIEYVNPAFERQTGYSLQEARGKNPRVLQSGQHNKAFYQQMWNTLIKGEVWCGHLINRRKNGTLFEEDVTISPVRNSEGNITNYVAVKRDVTREVSLEKQLHQAMKMEAIGTLAGGIAHDFNNIISMILGYAELVKMHLADDAVAKRDIGQIIAAANRAADLVQRILTFSRNEVETLRPLKLQHVVSEILEMLRSTLPATISLVQEIDDDCGAVMGDTTQVQQILMNLVTNAGHAMGKHGGIIRVGLQELQISAASPVNLHENISQGRWLDLEVSDTGSGMSPEIAERVFDPFFTTKATGEGTGLGLSVVHGIIKSFGGEITVNSLVGSGTTFHIYLPVIAKEQGRQEKEGANAPLPRGNECVLVLDDEPLLVDIMERNLVRLGYTVLAFTDSEAALQQFRQHAETIDLIITDMTMPGYTGAELAKRVLSITPEMPIILCSGFSEYIDDRKAREIGVCEFVEKPVNLRTLATVIRKVLDER